MNKKSVLMIDKSCVDEKEFLPITINLFVDHKKLVEYKLCGNKCFEKLEIISTYESQYFFRDCVKVLSYK